MQTNELVVVSIRTTKLITFDILYKDKSLKNFLKKFKGEYFYMFIKKYLHLDCFTCGFTF